MGCVGAGCRPAIGLRPAQPEPTKASKNRVVEPKYRILRSFRASAERVRRPLGFRVLRGDAGDSRPFPLLAWLWIEFFFKDTRA